MIFGSHDIDLDSEHPIFASTCSAHARNVAKDPVAAADFFDFMCRCLFEELFGWDFHAGKSKPKGGIFGKLCAYYGTAELTDRGNFHGHYMIWLCGAHNPYEVHNRMSDSDEYIERFFAFFEDIIHHDLPDMDFAFDPNYKPRIEMPPHVPLTNLEDLEDTQLQECEADVGIEFQ